MQNFKSSTRTTVVSSILAVIIALLCGMVIIALIGFNPFDAYQQLFIGSLGSINAVGETLVKATPLIFTGLSYAFARRCGIINLGAEGQLYIGALFSIIVGTSVELPILIHLPLTIIAGFIGGGLYGLLAGFLKTKFSASELITTIMLNYVAIQFISYCVTGPLKEKGGSFPQSSALLYSSRFPKILPGTRLHLGFVLAIIMLLFYYFFMWHTSNGYEIRVVGLNPTASEYMGVSKNKDILLAMFIAGGFGGLAGTTELLGLQFRLFQNFSPNYGFDGIAVALLGQNSPIGIFISSILFGALSSGSNMMELISNVPTSVVQILQALIILLVSGKKLMNLTFWNRTLNKLKVVKK